MSKYYYLGADRKQQGPIDTEEFSQHNIQANTLIWTNGMPDWTEAGKVAELSTIFAHMHNTPPPPIIDSLPLKEKPDNLLAWSILSTVLCCIPLGIVAIVYSAKVDKLWETKDYDGAIRAAKNAKLFCIISLVGGILIYFLSLFLVLIGAYFR